MYCISSSLISHVQRTSTTYKERFTLYLISFNPTILSSNRFFIYFFCAVGHVIKLLAIICIPADGATGKPTFFQPLSNRLCWSLTWYKATKPVLSTACLWHNGTNTWNILSNLSQWSDLLLCHVRFGILIRIKVLMIWGGGVLGGCNTNLYHKTETEVCWVSGLLEEELWYSN